MTETQIVLFIALYFLVGMTGIAITRARNGPWEDADVPSVLFVILINPVLWLAIIVGSFRDFVRWVRGDYL